ATRHGNIKKNQSRLTQYTSTDRLTKMIEIKKPPHNLLMRRPLFVTKFLILKLTGIFMDGQFEIGRQFLNGQ
ncbi:hypothetical protein, partial [uncultured Pedobacter sp.]|uniref:hypothetical protein n=1 Tax=uncultured Pedobacter sp. TaxID=246139 RepID=UPI0025E997E2